MRQENDKELKIVTAKLPQDFTEKMNALMEEGCWRVAETEMSVTDHHYWAMLIRNDSSIYVERASRAIKLLREAQDIIEEHLPAYIVWRSEASTFLDSVDRSYAKIADNQ